MEKRVQPSAQEEAEMEVLVGESDRAGPIEGCDREEEREGAGTGRNSNWPIERLRFCRP